MQLYIVKDKGLFLTILVCQLHASILASLSTENFTTYSFQNLMVNSTCTAAKLTVSIIDNNLTQRPTLSYWSRNKMPKLTCSWQKGSTIAFAPNSNTILVFSVQKCIASVGTLYCFMDNLTLAYSTSIWTS